MTKMTQEDIDYVIEHAKQEEPLAMFHLGVMHDAGSGVSHNPIKAFELYSKAAEAGLADAQYCLGLLFSREDSGIKNDLSMANKWFAKAADQGHPLAKAKLDFQ